MSSVLRFQYCAGAAVPLTSSACTGAGGGGGGLWCHGQCRWLQAPSISSAASAAARAVMPVASLASMGRTIRERRGGHMQSLAAFNFRQWIDANRAQLKPPVGNKRVFRDGDFIIMVVGGPNARKDYHVDPGEEFFYQLEGNMLLKTMQEGRAVDLPIRAGEILLLPANVPHSPQRPAGSVGLVIERARRPGEQDGFQWYCEGC